MIHLCVCKIVITFLLAMLCPRVEICPLCYLPCNIKQQTMKLLVYNVRCYFNISVNHIICADQYLSTNVAAKQPC